MMTTEVKMRILNLSFTILLTLYYYIILHIWQILNSTFSHLKEVDCYSFGLTRKAPLYASAVERFRLLSIYAGFLCL